MYQTEPSPHVKELRDAVIAERDRPAPPIADRSKLRAVIALNESVAAEQAWDALLRAR